MLIASCSRNTPTPQTKTVVVDTACSWVRIIRLTQEDIKALDPRTKRDILAHDIAVDANCPGQT
ncbi:hypothetical protein SJI19_21750 [Acerihabitans sp. TG2]|uniref:hypothetical protein n=1 Tax=Acerihabitans sp. TG2 TaxID=3096008 RepID=UPI002B2376A8|nr:hypothetical protein [Acerihabitans sp. TG2]MEA9393128.1 hypothetical protein [Acerihabitans sp. TG2]